MPRFRCHARCSGSRLKTTVLAFHFGVLTLTANEKWPALFNWGAPQLNIGRRFRRSTPVTGFAPRDRTFDGSGLEPLGGNRLDPPYLLMQRVLPMQTTVPDFLCVVQQ